MQELVILPVDPNFKNSSEVFITKKNLDLRQDPPLDIQVKNFDLNFFNQIFSLENISHFTLKLQVFSVLRPIPEKKRNNENNKKYSKKVKMRFPTPHRESQFDFHEVLKQRFLNDLKNSDPNVVATLEETLALDDKYNLIELLHLGLSHKIPTNLQ